MASFSELHIDTTFLFAIGKKSANTPAYHGIPYIWDGLNSTSLVNGVILFGNFNFSNITK